MKSFEVAIATVEAFLPLTQLALNVAMLWLTLQ